MELFFKAVLLGYFTLFVTIALLWRSRLVFRQTGVNALTQSNKSPLLKFLAIVFKLHLALALGLVVDYVFGLGTLSANRFSFLVSDTIATAGSVLLMLCLVLIVTAQNQMKTSWRIEIDTENSTALIGRGLFRHSRNPIFLALRLSYFAMFLIVPCPYSLITLLIGDLAFQMQVRQEEQHLLKTHGSEYVDYCSRVRRWV